MKEQTILIAGNASSAFVTWRLELIEALQKSFNVVLSSPFNDEDRVFLENMGCECVTAPVDRRGVNPIKDVFLLIHYFKLFRKLKPSVIVTYTIKPNIYAGIAASILKIPYITTINGLGTAIYNPSFLQKILLLLFKYVFKHAHHVYLQNTAIKDFFSIKNTFSTQKSSVINGSGVNIEKFRPLPYPNNEAVLYFLYIGRMMDEKGVPYFMEAAQCIIQDFPCAEFHLIGGCEYGYEARMKEWQQQKGIFYHGRQSDVREFLAQAHCLVHPTYYPEGISNVCLEAAACARPIIASTIPGCRETFDEGVSGFGIEAKNVDSLEATLRKFIALPYETKVQMGLAGRQKVEKEFDRTLVVQAYLSKIKEILTEK